MGYVMKNLIALVIVACLLSACNTIRGVGKDLEKAGEAVQKSTQ